MSAGKNAKLTPGTALGVQSKLMNVVIRGMVLAERVTRMSTSDEPTGGRLL